VFLCAAAIYLAITFMVTRLVAMAERRIAPDLQLEQPLVAAH
jgi:ABC-type amino acid transport system permease subunit